MSAVGIDEHVAAAAVLDELDIVQRIAAVDTAVHLPAAVDGNDVRERERRRVSGRVEARAAVEGIDAEAAGEDVVAGIAGERIVAAAAGDVLDPGPRREPGEDAGGEIDGHALIVPV